MYALKGSQTMAIVSSPESLRRGAAKEGKIYYPADLWMDMVTGKCHDIVMLPILSSINALYVEV